MEDGSQGHDEVLDTVWALHVDGDSAAALTRAQDWVETYPTDSRMWTNIAMIHRAGDDNAASLAAIRRAVTVAPDDLDAWFVYATLPDQPDGDREEQTLASRELIERAPTLSTGYQLAFQRLKELGDVNGAYDVLEAMESNVAKPGSPLPDLDAPPIRASFWLGSVSSRSIAALEARDWPAVRVAAHTWTQLQPGAARAWLHRSLAELNEDQDAHALPLLRRLTQLDPNDPQAWVLLSQAIRLTHGSRTEQLAAAQRAAALDPTDPQARRSLADAGARVADRDDVREKWPAAVASLATVTCLAALVAAHQGGLGTGEPPSRPGQPWAGLLVGLPVLGLALTALFAQFGGGLVHTLRTTAVLPRLVFGLSAAVSALTAWLLLAPSRAVEGSASVTYPMLWVLTAPLALGTLTGWRPLAGAKPSREQPADHP